MFPLIHSASASSLPSGLKTKNFLLGCVLVFWAVVFTTPYACAQPEAATQMMTGSRHWRMSDGSLMSMRFMSFSSNGKVGQFGLHAAPTVFKPLSAFAQEEQEVFNGLKNGSIKLVVTPGLSMDPDFPTGKLSAFAREYGSLRYGETRFWENTGGKRIQARLVCLTDEEVAVMVQDSVVRIPISSLSAADLAYLDRIKRDEAPLFLDRVILYTPNWENSRAFRFIISGEHYAALAQRKVDFEGALAAALRHVGSKLKKGAWELDQFSEVEFETPVHPLHENETVDPMARKPCWYQAYFVLTKGGAMEARRHWPLNTSSPSWKAEQGLYLCVLADGDIPTAEIRPSIP